MDSKTRFELAKEELKKVTTFSIKYNYSELFCILHEKDYLGTHGEKSHACLGCNLNKALGSIYRFLDQNRTKNDVEYTFTTYILLTFILIEKLTTIFRIIGITQEYVEKNWPVLHELRKWANFVKHPKGFLFSHHSEYIVENLQIPHEWRNHTRIDFHNFVEPLYKREDEGKFQESFQRFANKRDLLVIIPDPARLTAELIVVCSEFCQKIKNNEHFKNILMSNSVLENYNE